MARQRKNNPVKRRITNAQIRAIAGSKINLLEAIAAPPRKFNPKPPVKTQPDASESQQERRRRV